MERERQVDIVTQSLRVEESESSFEARSSLQLKSEDVTFSTRVIICFLQGHFSAQSCHNRHHFQPLQLCPFPRRFHLGLLQKIFRFRFRLDPFDFQRVQRVKPPHEVIGQLHGLKGESERGICSSILNKLKTILSLKETTLLSYLYVVKVKTFVRQEMGESHWMNQEGASDLLWGEYRGWQQCAAG